MLVQSGIPVIYSGDEIGQENDYTYHKDPKKWEDSRYLHRGKFQWENEKFRKQKGTVQQRIFDGLKKLETVRMRKKVFCGDADVWTVDTWDKSILGIIRANEEEKLIALFNFSEFDKTAWINEEDGIYTDLITGREMEARGVNIPAYGVYWLYKKCEGQKEA